MHETKIIKKKSPGWSFCNLHQIIRRNLRLAPDSCLLIGARFSLLRCFPSCLFRFDLDRNVVPQLHSKASIGTSV